MIEVTHLTKRFGRFHAVRDVSFGVAAGEAVALWGSNGAGKTTVIRCLLGLLRFGGRIVAAGHDVRRDGRAARRAIGYVPQELALYDDFRLAEAVHFFARLKRAPRARVATVLRDVGLATHRRKRVRELSGGMKQRLALGIALLADPPLLVLDELTSNLDAEAQSGFMGDLIRLRREGKTILFTSHHREEVRALADRVLVMEAGRVERSAPAGVLAAAPDARCMMKVILDEAAVEKALAVLRDGGFDASRNGRGVLVEVRAGEKAAPIRVLSRADVDVRDFMVGGDPVIESPARAGEEDVPHA